MTTDEKRQALRDAYNFNARYRAMGSCTHPYMGSMATFSLCRILGGSGFALIDAIDKADDSQLDAGIEYCREHHYLRVKTEPTMLWQLEVAIADILQMGNDMTPYEIALHLQERFPDRLGED